MSLLAKPVGEAKGSIFELCVSDLLTRGGHDESWLFGGGEGVRSWKHGLDRDVDLAMVSHRTPIFHRRSGRFFDRSGVRRIVVAFDDGREECTSSEFGMRGPQWSCGCSRRVRANPVLPLLQRCRYQQYRDTVRFINEHMALDDETARQRGWSAGERGAATDCAQLDTSAAVDLEKPPQAVLAASRSPRSEPLREIFLPEPRKRIP